MITTCVCLLSWQMNEVLVNCQEGGISAVGGTGSIYTFYGPDEPKFKNLTTNFLEKDSVCVVSSIFLPGLSRQCAVSTPKS